MKDKYNYIGLFVDLGELGQIAQSINPDRLGKVISHPHVTFAYRPGSVDESLFGTQAEIILIGYANDGLNEGFSVEINSHCEKIRAMSERIEVPHITVSISPESEAVKTKFLVFEPIEPVTIQGVFGGFLTCRRVVTEPTDI